MIYYNDVRIIPGLRDCRVTELHISMKNDTVGYDI